MSNGSAGVVPSSLRMVESRAVVISADCICAGVQSGWSALISAAEPAMCGLDIDVPLSSPYSGDAVGSVVWTGARTSTPGAEMSGLSTPGTEGFGPRELNPAITSPFSSRWSAVVPAMVAV